MSDLNLNLQLLRGKPIEVNGIKIHAPTLDQIVDISIDKYYRYLNLLCVDRETINDLLEELDEKLTVFEFVYINSRTNEEYRKLIFEAFDFFLKEEVKISDVGFYLDFMSSALYKQLDDNIWHGKIPNCKGVLAKGNTKKECEDKLKEVYINWSIINSKIITEDIFNEIVKILRLQNCLVDKKEEEKIKPANERARQMLEQMKKNQEELNKAKAKDSLDLCDLISIFAAYSENMSILDVWDLNFYQFNDQFNRLKIMKEYDANLQIIMHCDTSKNKIDLKHWMSK